MAVGGVSGVDDSALRRSLRSNLDDFVYYLDSNNAILLSSLVDHRLLSKNDRTDLLMIDDPKRRNAELLQRVLANDCKVKNSHEKFVEALRKSRQKRLADTMDGISSKQLRDTEVGMEDDVIGRHRGESATESRRRRKAIKSRLREFDQYLTTESRRAKVRYSASMDRHRARRAHSLPPRAAGATVSRARRGSDEVTWQPRYNDILDTHADIAERLRLLDRQVHKPGMAGSHSEAPALRHQQRATGAKVTSSDGVEQLVSTLKPSVTKLGELLRIEERHGDVCQRTIDRMRREVAAAKSGHPPLPEHEITSPRGGGETRQKRRRTGGGMGQLRTRLALLSSELNDMMRTSNNHHRKTTRNSSDPVRHRNFDQVDHDLSVLQRELRQNDKSSSVQAVQRLADVTRSERDDCVRMIDDMQRLVHRKRIRIQDITGVDPSRVTASSGKRSRLKTSTVRRVESNMSEKLTSLGDEVNQFVDVAFSHAQTAAGDYAKRRHELDERIRTVTNDGRRLKFRVRDAEAEATRYRRLYEQARTIIQQRGLASELPRDSRDPKDHRDHARGFRDPSRDSKDPRDPRDQATGFRDPASRDSRDARNPRHYPRGVIDPARDSQGNLRYWREGEWRVKDAPTGSRLPLIRRGSERRRLERDQGPRRTGASPHRSDDPLHSLSEALDHQHISRTHHNRSRSTSPSEDSYAAARRNSPGRPPQTHAEPVSTRPSRYKLRSASPSSTMDSASVHQGRPYKDKDAGELPEGHHQLTVPDNQGGGNNVRWYYGEPVKVPTVVVYYTDNPPAPQKSSDNEDNPYYQPL